MTDTGTSSKKAVDGDQRATTSTKPINLALQGGGAHGAFTWGVLDRLLASGRIAVSAISGTSAGAINAVVAADGIMAGGRKGARNALLDFWKSISQAAQMSPAKRTLLDALLGNWNLDYSPGYLAMDFLNRLASPYQLNPLDINPLRDLIDELVDFERVRSCDRLKLFISATSVQTGQVRVFRRKELTADAIMASACLPQLFQAVRIDGEDFWDGGFSGNPVLYPFAYYAQAPDVVVVQINPLCCQKTPTTARDILNRVNEITFNASLLNELRAIEFVGRLVDSGALDPKRYKRLYIHMIADPEGFAPLNASSKLNADWQFLCHMRDLGRAAAGRWLDEHYEKIGKQASVDVRGLLH
ncbi:MAG: patatin-like phospholipase family protein [Desulfobacteraceae bacterium]|jgi:NTE family protein